MPVLPPRSHGGDENHLSHRRGGDAVPGQTVRAPGQSHLSGFQKCPQQPTRQQLQILLQIHGPGFWVSGHCHYDGYDGYDDYDDYYGDYDYDQLV